MELHQTKKILHSKGSHQQNEKTTYGKDKIFVNHVLDKWLTSKLYKELIPLNSKNKAKQPNYLKIIKVPA